MVHNADNTDAGTVIINTCGFINDAKEESVDTILRFVKAQKSGQIENLYVMGCLAERYADALRLEIPEVKKYFGVNNITDILSELGVNFRNDLSTERTISGPGHYAYLKISEGCNRVCAFCAIPFIRGKYISRPVEDLVKEANLLANNGVKELILIAQDLSYYGLDLYKRQALPELVTELLKIESFEWIRLHYLYPANFPAELIPIIRDNPRICRYIDIPIQHITDNMLDKMRRSHNREETLSILNRLRNEIPGSVIRTTLIAGHPGETEEDFNELRDFITNFRFDRLGVFVYSPEDNTVAGGMDGQLPARVKQQRRRRIMALQQQISRELLQAQVGRTLRVLVEKQMTRGLVGRTAADAPEIDGTVRVRGSSPRMLRGEFADVRITGATEYDMVGVL